MTAEETKRLEEELAEARLLLQDATDEKNFIVRQSGVHLSRTQWEQYDREIEKYERLVRELEEKLGKPPHTE